MFFGVVQVHIIFSSILYSNIYSKYLLKRKNNKLLLNLRMYLKPTFSHNYFNFLFS